MKFSKQVQEYFHFSKTERNGIALLSLLIMIGLIFPVLYQKFYQEPKIDFSDLEEKLRDFDIAENSQEKIPQAYFTATKKVDTIQKSFSYFNPNTVTKQELQNMPIPQKAIKSLINYRSKGGRFRDVESLKKLYGMDEMTYRAIRNYVRLEDQADSTIPKTQNTQSEENFIPTEKFNFDPNTVNQLQLQQLGFPEKVARTLLNFRNKGGSIRRAEDLKKIYGMTDDLFNSLQPFINIEKDSPPKKIAVSQSMDAEAAPVNIDINTASAEEWQQLKGIGPYWSGRIIKYRDALGGFTSIEQIKETYHFPDSVYQQIQPFLIYKTKPKIININEITLEELKAHPYLNYKQAKGIINFRTQHGTIKSKEHLSELRSLTSAQIERINPYLEY